MPSVPDEARRFGRVISNACRETEVQWIDGDKGAVLVIPGRCRLQRPLSRNGHIFIATTAEAIPEIKVLIMLR